MYDHLRGLHRHPSHPSDPSDPILGQNCQLEDGPRDRPRRAGSNDQHGGHESWFDDWMIDGT